MAEDYGPTGDETRHRPTRELEEGLRKLAPAPTETGRVAMIVARRADGVRDVLASARLAPETGVPGDRWERMKRDFPEMQLAVMRRDVAELIANGQPLTMFGDNLLVDLDISAANLPFGTRLRVGTAVLEMTPEPHDGCRKFRARFGADALRFVQNRSTRDQNLRGVYWTVIEAGTAAESDPIQVLSRPD